MGLSLFTVMQQSQHVLATFGLLLAIRNLKRPQLTAAQPPPPLVRCGQELELTY